MQKIHKKIVVFYHGDCADGFGGAWAAWKKFGNRADYIALYRDNPVPDIRDKEVYFIDFAYSPEITKKFIRNNKKVIGLDHHITAAPSVKLMAKGSVCSGKHSGAVWAWKYFHVKKKTPLFLRYVEDQDTWRWALPASKEIAVVMDIFAFNFRFWDKVVREFEKAGGRKKYTQQGRFLKNYKDFIVKKLADTAEVIKFAGRKILAVNAPHIFASELGYILAVKRPPFGLVWRKAGRNILVSLRANGAIDVAKIAQKFGGGGHKAAAGFEIPEGKKIPWKPVKK